MQKSADAYRTIGEVAEALKLPQHVLRFWETRFPQVKPMKRGGNRRFYRPEDVELLRAIKILLYGDGYTIKGVQRLLREQGPRAVSVLGVEAASRSAATPEWQDADDAGRREGPRQRSETLAKPVVKDPPYPHRAPADALPGRPPSAAPHRPPSSASSGSVADRLQAVLADLAECTRILAAARDGRDP